MSTPTVFGLTAINSALAEHLESTITVAARCALPWLDGGLRPLLTRPGKRLRPALLFATAACGRDIDRAAAVKCAASLELMHLSSLVHDDLMDQADTRGGVPTLHKTIGPDGAIVGGDYLLAVGGRLAAEVAAESAVVWHESYADLCFGQASETANRYRTDTTIAEYLAAVRGKTAALMRAACRLGAVCGGLGPAEVDAFSEFGEAFGMVFQLVDDVMDVFSSIDLWAKPVEQDVPNGVYTPCVHAAFDDRLPGGDRRVRDLLGPAMTAHDVRRVYEQVRRAGVSAALDLVDQYVTKAELALSWLPPSPALTAVVELPRLYVDGAVRSKVDPRFGLRAS